MKCRKIVQFPGTTSGYESFDSKRKKAEALAADEKDFKQLEELEKKLLEKGKKKK